MRASLFLVSFIFLIMGCDKSTPEALRPQKQESNEIPQVKAAIIKGQEVPLTTELIGEVRAYKTASVRPEIDAIIETKLFEEGSYVERGDLLYQMKSARLEVKEEMASARLESAKVSLAYATNNLERGQNLIRQNQISEDEYQKRSTALLKARAQVSLKEAELKNAKLNYEASRIYAPIAGYIGESSVEEGAFVSIKDQTPLTVIRQLDPILVDLSKPEGAEKEGMKVYSLYQKNKRPIFVTLNLPEYEINYALRGRLESPKLALGSKDGKFDLVARFSNPDITLLPGMKVTASIEGGETSHMSLVPLAAVSVDENGKTFVWKISDENKVSKQVIKTGRIYQIYWTVQSGLEVGERVALDHLGELAANERVTPELINLEAESLLSE